MWLLLLLLLKKCKAQQAVDTKAAYLINQFLDAHTAYGPGLGVFSTFVQIFAFLLLNIKEWGLTLPLPCPQSTLCELILAVSNAFLHVCI